MVNSMKFSNGNVKKILLSLGVSQISYFSPAYKTVQHEICLDKYVLTERIYTAVLNLDGLNRW
jgi:hypothetical protein